MFRFGDAVWLSRRVFRWSQRSGISRWHLVRRTRGRRCASVGGPFGHRYGPRGKANRSARTRRVGRSQEPWEVAAKAESEKLRFDRPYGLWIDQALTHDPRIEVLHLLPRIAVEAAKLPWDHRDPADRFIVATARVEQSALVTSDTEIQESRLARCIWD